LPDLPDSLSGPASPHKEFGCDRVLGPQLGDRAIRQLADAKGVFNFFDEATIMIDICRSTVSP
jgi:hypothetical protein